MKINVLGVKHIEGTKKSTGDDFDMSRISVSLPIGSVDTDNLKITGYGHEPAEMPLDPECIDQFKPFKDKFPCYLTLTTEPVLYRGKIEQMVTGTTTQSVSTPAQVKSA